MAGIVSIAIETSCRSGAVALGLDDALARVVDFDASARHATQLVPRLDELLRSAGLRPADVNEVYVSAGPGSFTGLRVGITVARTLAQAVPRLRCVAVPTVLAIAENVREMEWSVLGVALDAREDLIYACLFRREGDEIVREGPPRMLPPRGLLAAFPRPLLLAGEGLAYHDLSAEGVTFAFPPGSPRHLPTARGVWRVGRRMSLAGQFTDCRLLLPIYARAPEAVRLWEKRHGPAPR